MNERIGQSDEQDVRDRLRALRVDPPDGDFAASLHRRLAAEPAPAAPGLWPRLREWLEGRGRLLWPAFGAAMAMAALLLVLTTRTGGVVAPPAPVPDAVKTAEVELPKSKVALVHVSLTADAAVASATIRVALPAGLVFWSDGEALAERAFEWTQPLDAGLNEIPIAVRGERPGTYRMSVRALIGTEWVEHDILLEVVDG